MKTLTKQHGFTLLEIMTVIVVIGILSAMSVVRAGTARSRAYRASMQEDLRTMAVAQESYYSEHQTYASSLSDLDMQLSSGVTAKIKATSVGWTAQTKHPLAEGRKCALYVGDISPFSPASKAGVLECAGTVAAPGCGG